MNAWWWADVAGLVVMNIGWYAVLLRRESRATRGSRRRDSLRASVTK